MIHQGMELYLFDVERILRFSECVIKRVHSALVRIRILSHVMTEYCLLGSKFALLWIRKLSELFH